MLQDQYGAVVRHYRMQAGLTQAELARKSRLSVEMIGRIERGQARPSFKTVAALARVLKTPVSNFFVAARSMPTRRRNDPLSKLIDRLARLSVQELEWVDRLLDVALRRGA